MKEVKQKTVLIVDDNQQIIEIIKTFLKEEGYLTISASTGAEALEIIEEEVVDLVLLDVLMPGMSGFEVCREIKFGRNYQHLPVVLITSLEAREDRLKGLEAGADDFLSKPVDWAELIGRVKSLLRIKTAYDRLEEQLARMEYQLEMARGIQRALARVDIPPELAGEIFYRPLDQVGGDIYHITRLGDHRYGIFFGDSAGHGVPAALVMVAVKFILTNLDLQKLTPGEVLDHINQRLIEYFSDGLQNIYVTAVYLELDLINRMISWANGGHLPPILFNSELDWRKLNSADIPLGILPEARYQNHRHHYSHADYLLLYTDGLVDFLAPGSSVLPDEVIASTAAEITADRSQQESPFFTRMAEDVNEKEARDDISYGLFII